MSPALVAILVLSTFQIPGTLRYGEHTFTILEVPMLGLWDYGDGTPAPGKVKPPSFDFVSTANWKGYEATWLIKDSKLMLYEIMGKKDGKKVRNEDIFPGKSFPLLADWYTGRIHLRVGGYNQRQEAYEAVIVCHIEKGHVKKMTFEPILAIEPTWNGLSPSENEDEPEGANHRLQPSGGSGRS